MSGTMIFLLALLGVIHFLIGLSVFYMVFLILEGE